MASRAAASVPVVTAIVHGVSIIDESFHVAPTELLEGHFRAAFEGSAPDPKEALIWAPVHWAPVFDDRQRKLVEILLGETGEGEGELSSLARLVNRGDKVALSRLLRAFGRRSRGLRLTRLRRWFGLSSPASDLNWLGLRWLLIYYVGDVLGYPDSPSTRRSYARVHSAFADALAGPAATHPNAPLAVIAHSLGTIVTSDFFYDLRARAPKGDGPDTALQRGETLASFMSLGSPMALWMTRADPEQGMDCPITVPAPELRSRFGARAEGFGWLNYYDPDDIIASPLRKLSHAYGEAVKEDIPVEVGGAYGGSPLAHPFYWSDEAVARHMAHQLAALWLAHNPGRYRLRPAPRL